jgi:hypothetical protein
MALTELLMASSGRWQMGMVDVVIGVRVQRPPVVVDHVPVRMTVSLRVMVTAVLVNMALQPWAHSCEMESSEWEARCGNTCACRADSGMPGILRLPVWVLVMMVPSGRETLMRCSRRWAKCGQGLSIL